MVPLKKSALGVVLGISLLINGCSFAVTPSPILVTPTEAAVLAAVATPHPQLTLASDILKNEHIIEQCPDILPATSISEIESDGVVVLLKGRYLDDIREAYLLDLASLQLIEFSQEDEILSYHSIAVSPDRKTLAYSAINPKDETIHLFLSSSAAERQKITLIESDIAYPMYGDVGEWLNNHQFLLNRDVFDPYTQEKRSFNPKDFPGILPDDFGTYSLQFDPEVTRVVYPHSHATTAIADLSTKQILAELPAQSRGVPKIAWSPSGSFVAIIGTNPTQERVSDEIFLVERDGKNIQQVTRLSTYYDGGEYLLSSPAWSPDGQSITFWQNHKNELRLFVLNIETEELKSYCIWGKPRNAMFYAPIWSPDGTQLLIQDFRIKDKAQAVIVDIDKNVAIPIGEDFIPVGWMIAP